MSQLAVARLVCLAKEGKYAWLWIGRKLFPIRVVSLEDGDVQQTALLSRKKLLICSLVESSWKRGRGRRFDLRFIVEQRTV